LDREELKKKKKDLGLPLLNVFKKGQDRLGAALEEALKQAVYIEGSNNAAQTSS